MFTGLIEALGRVSALDRIEGGFRLLVETPLAGDLRAGDSVAVNGACLTVVASEDGRLAFDLGPETARVTALGDLRGGRAVNLERAMRADARVGGHFVQGHVDATGRLEAVRPDGAFVWLTFSYPRGDAAYLIPKGAVAVEGISLTVASLDGDRFDVQIIPFTWRETNLSTLTAGERVNLEYDMLGKYVVRAAALIAQGRSPAPIGVQP
jgi:riboflavin synthase alpha subunit